MSLIREALKKAQEEREKAYEMPEDVEDRVPAHLKQSQLAISGKRMLIVLVIVASAGLLAVLASFLIKPSMPPAIVTSQATPPTDSSSAISKPAASSRITEPAPAPTPINPASTSSVASTEPPINRQNAAPPVFRDDENSPPAVPRKPKKDTTTEAPPTSNITQHPSPATQTVKKETTDIPGLRPLPDTGETDEKAKQIPPSPAETLADEGDRYYNRQEFTVALDRYKKALAADRRVSLYLRAYNAARAMNNPILAQGYINDGLKYFPESFALNKIAAIIQLREKQYSLALENLRIAVEQNNGDYSVWTYKGICHFHQNQLQTSMDCFRRSLSINDDAVENYYYIALIHDRQKDYSKALEFYRAFSKLSGGNDSFRHSEWVSRRIAELQRYLENRR